LHFKLTFCSSFPSLGYKLQTKTEALHRAQNFGKDSSERKEEPSAAQPETEKCCAIPEG
jgi:hypothetical protein